MGDLSNHDAEETRKVSMEILSDDEETKTEERGSSSDKTDIVADSPPTNPTKTPAGQPSIAAEPTPPPPEATTQPISPPKDQSTIPPSHKEPNQSPKPLEEEAPIESHHQQPSVQEASTINVVASEATTAEIEGEKVKSLTRRMRVKHAMTLNPFGKRKKGEAVVVLEEEPEQVEKESDLQQPVKEDLKRAKLQVRKKQGAKRGKPATSTCGAFVAPEHEDAADKSAKEAEAAVSKDATTSKELEVENTQIQPATSKEDDPADVAKKQAWEEAKQRLAANIAKEAQQAPPVPVASAEVSTGPIASDDTTVTGAEEQAKKKEEGC